MDFRIVVIGASLGGTQAIGDVLKSLPRDFPLPVAIVQHRNPDSTEILVSMLQKSSPLSVMEVEDKQDMLPGHVFLAPADYHLLVEGDHFALSTEAPVLYARPSIDVLFESTAHFYGDHAIGVILTGASEDGAQGLAAIKRRGGMTVVQAPESAEARLMPEAAIAATAVDMILPLEDIGAFLTKVVEAGQQIGIKRQKNKRRDRE